MTNTIVKNHLVRVWDPKTREPVEIWVQVSLNTQEIATKLGAKLMVSRREKPAASYMRGAIRAKTVERTRP